MANPTDASHGALLGELSGRDRVDAVLARLEATTAGVAPSVAGRKIDLDRCNVTDADILRLAAGFASTQASGGGAPVALSLQGNALTDAGVPGLCEILKMGVLRELVLAYNNLSGDGVTLLADALPSDETALSSDAEEDFPTESSRNAAHTLLEVLDLTFNDVGDGGAIALAGALRRGANVGAVRLYRCHVGDEGVVALAEAIYLGGSSSPVVELDLGCNSFGSTAIAAIGAAVATGRVRTLSLRNNDLRHTDLPDLCVEIKDARLEHLDLRKNKLGDLGAAYLAEVLKTCTRLTSVDLRGNKITAVGVRHLALALEDNDSLLELDLDPDPDPDAVLPIFLSALLDKNLKLTRLQRRVDEYENQNSKTRASHVDLSDEDQAHTMVASDEPQSSVSEDVNTRDTLAAVADRSSMGSFVATAVAVAAVAYVMVWRPGCPAAYS